MREVVSMRKFQLLHGIKCPDFVGIATADIGKITAFHRLQPVINLIV
jgi:hypothetical protein